MPTQVTIKGPRHDHRGVVMVQQLDPANLGDGKRALSSPVVLGPGDERDFWLDQANGKAYLVTEHLGSPPVSEQALVIPITRKRNPRRR